MSWQIERSREVVGRRAVLSLFVAGTAAFVLPDFALAKPRVPGEPEPKPDDAQFAPVEIPLVIKNPATGEMVARMNIIHPQGLEHPETGSYRLDLEKDVLHGPPNPKALRFREHLDLLVQFSDTRRRDLIVLNMLGSGNPAQEPSVWVSLVDQPDFAVKHLVETSWHDWKINEVKWDGTPIPNLYNSSQRI